VRGEGPFWVLKTVESLRVSPDPLATGDGFALRCLFRQPAFDPDFRLSNVQECPSGKLRYKHNNNGVISENLANCKIMSVLIYLYGQLNCYWATSLKALRHLSPERRLSVCHTCAEAVGRNETSRGTHTRVVLNETGRGYHVMGRLGVGNPITICIVTCGRTNMYGTRSDAAYWQITDHW